MSNQSVEKIVALSQVLKKVMPTAGEDLIATVAHDISDVWKIAENHRARVEKILKMQSVADQDELSELFEDLCYGDARELMYHIESMEKTLPGIIETLGSRRG